MSNDALQSTNRTDNTVTDWQARFSDTLEHGFSFSFGNRFWPELGNQVSPQRSNIPVSLRAHLLQAKIGEDETVCFDIKWQLEFDKYINVVCMKKAWQLLA